MAFPCNQFGGQEPGGDAEILKFAESHGFPDPQHTAGFKMFSKTFVNGPETIPVFVPEELESGQIKRHHVELRQVFSGGGRRADKGVRVCI